MISALTLFFIISGNLGPGPGHYDPFKPKPMAPIDYVSENDKQLTCQRLFSYALQRLSGNRL